MLKNIKFWLYSKLYNLFYNLSNFFRGKNAKIAHDSKNDFLNNRFKTKKTRIREFNSAFDVSHSRVEEIMYYDSSKLVNSDKKTQAMIDHIRNVLDTPVDFEILNSNSKTKD